MGRAALPGIAAAGALMAACSGAWAQDVIKLKCQIQGHTMTKFAQRIDYPSETVDVRIEHHAGGVKVDAGGSKEYALNLSAPTHDTAGGVNVVKDPAFFVKVVVKEDNSPNNYVSVAIEKSGALDMARVAAWSAIYTKGRCTAL